MENNTVLKATNINYSYKYARGEIDILNNLNLTVKINESVAIIGKSGSGKSTLLHILGGLDNPKTGEVFIYNKNLLKANNAERGKIRNKYLGFIYQFHHLLPEFSALENVAMPLLIRKYNKKQSFLEAQSILDKVGVGNRAQHRPSELSGGERQRVAIARALVTKPSCILADEPTGNLDEETTKNIMNLLFDLQKNEKISLIIVTHDTSISKSMNKTYNLVDKNLHLI